MSPVAQSERHNAPWLVGELVPRMAGDIDDIVIGFEDSV